MSATETYRVTWPGNTPTREEFIGTLPAKSPEGAPWDRVTSGQFACQWRRLEHDMSQASAEFPGVHFEVVTRDTRHDRHHLVQHFQDGKSGPRRQVRTPAAAMA